MCEPKKHKRPVGRPKEKVSDKVDLEKIEFLAGLGLSDIEIAYQLNVHPLTIDKWKKDEQFQQAYKRGKVSVTSAVENRLYKAAIAGNTTAQIFWLKNRRPDKWNDRKEVTQPTTKYAFDLEKLSIEEIRQLRDIMGKVLQQAVSEQGVASVGGNQQGAGGEELAGLRKAMLVSH